ncbi:MAG: hypothetical protein K2G73_06000 [Eubacterium sp.]|nr:hypothetical protein [Eubacterium sp.]
MLKDKKKTTVSDYIKAFVLALMSSLAVVVSNGTYIATDSLKEELGSQVLIDFWQIKAAFSYPDYSVYMLVIMAFFGFIYLIPKVSRRNIKWGIPFSIIGALFVLLCDSYFELNSWDKVFGSVTAVVTSCFKGIGIATLIFFVYDIANRVNIEKLDALNKGFDKKVFIKLTLIMIACWVPYMIIMAPGSMGTDTRDQFAQILGNGEMSWSPGTVPRKPTDILLTNHHPVAHTLLLGIFLKFGELIGSYFAGIELYCVLQSCVFAAALTYSVIKLQEYGMSERLAKIVYLFFTLCPLFPLWGMTTFKDTPFAIMLLVVTILLYDAFKMPEKFTKSKYWVLAAALFVLLLVRNNSFYMLLLLLPFAVIHFRKDKKFVIKVISVMLIPLLIFKVGFTGVAFKVAGVNNGSPREMLSVPFQQTARYIVEFENEITPEEEMNIRTILGGGELTLAEIAAEYVPDRSDPVKGEYNKYATTEDLLNYFKTWFAQLVKHPACYVEAFLNLNFSWFSSESNHDAIIYNGNTDETIPDYLEGLDNPEVLDGARSAVSQMVNALDRIPVISCLFEFSFYTWCYVVIFLAMLMRKRYTELLVCLPIFANYAICFVGPVAYMRYVIPMIVCIPFVIFITFSRRKNNNEDIEPEGNEIWIK